MMKTAEKTIYLLLACDLQKVHRFLNKYPCSFPENKSFPPSFIRQSRKTFQKNQKEFIKLKLKVKGQAISPKAPAEELLGPWKCFCQHNPYEEALVVVLCGILKYPLEQATWLLKTAPETLSYRLQNGLLALAKELVESPVSQALKQGQKPVLESHFRDKPANSQALTYCQWLRERDWPVLNKAKTSKIKKYVFFLTLFTAILILLIFLSQLLTPSRVILYQHFYDKIF